MPTALLLPFGDTAVTDLSTTPAYLIDVAVTALAAINADQRAGTVPADVPSFSALHDHVDANQYLIDALETHTLDGLDLHSANTVADLIDNVLKDRLTRTPVTTHHGDGTVTTDRTDSRAEVLRSQPVDQPATIRATATIREDKARDEWDVDSVVVQITYDVEGIDRPDGYGISTGRTDTPARRKRALALAERLKRAVDAQAVMHDLHVRRDVNGNTYVAASSRILGRHLNADLKALGY